MKRIIVAARDRADIIRRRDEYQAEYETQKAKYESEFMNYERAKKEITDSVENEVISKLDMLVDKLNIDVNASFSWDTNTVEIRVNSNQHNVHSKDKALSWDWKVKLNTEGEIVKESNSWSGLNAVTDEQIHSLKLSVAALEILNQLDWKSILNKVRPKYDEYISTVVPENREREFQKELDEADLEEAIESKSILRGIKHSGKHYRGLVYYSVLRETPKQYEIIEIPDSYLDYLRNGQKIGLTVGDHLTTDEDKIAKEITKPQDFIEYFSRYSYMVRKETFEHMVEKPFVILDNV